MTAISTQRVSADRTTTLAVGRVWTALAALAGGALWIAFAVLAAGQPQGCVGDECLLNAHRDLGAYNALLAAGGLLILGAFAGVARGRASRAAVAGGVTVMVAALTVGAPWAVVTAGMAATVAGFALAGIGLTPRWAGLLLTGSSLLLFAANDQDARVLLLIPFAVTWMAIGALRLRAGSTRERDRSYR